MNPAPPDHWLAKATRGRLRWVLISWMFMVSAVAYLDRVNISVAAQAIQKAAQDFLAAANPPVVFN